MSNKTLAELAQELGGTVGKTDWTYETESRRAKPKRDSKRRTREIRQARKLKQDMFA